MATQPYVHLSAPGGPIAFFQNMDPATTTALDLPINMTPQPSFDPIQQVCAQTAWTIGPVDVQPVWAVSPSPAAIAAAAQANYQAVIAGNVVTACTNAIVNWGTMNAAQKDVVLLTLVKVMKALLQTEFGVNN